MTSETNRSTVGDPAIGEVAPTELLSLAKWEQLGRRALGLEPPIEHRKLREILSECASLAIVETWLANGRNRTHTAMDLGISRRVVRKTVDAWEAAQKAGEHGSELPSSSTATGGIA